MKERKMKWKKNRKKTDMQTSIKCSVMCTVKEQYWFQNPLSQWKSLSIPVIPCTCPPSLATPCTYPLCHFSAPIIPCTCPLSSLASLCHPLNTHCHPKSSPVIPCTCLCHPCLPPSSSTRSLAARWSVVLTIHNHVSCHKSWKSNHPSVNLYVRYRLTLKCIFNYLIGITMHW